MQDRIWRRGLKRTLEPLNIGSFEKWEPETDINGRI
jgi:hypothetical protein